LVNGSDDLGALVVQFRHAASVRPVRVRCASKPRGVALRGLVAAAPHVMTVPCRRSTHRCAPARARNRFTVPSSLVFDRQFDGWVRDAGSVVAAVFSTPFPRRGAVSSVGGPGRSGMPVAWRPCAASASPRSGGMASGAGAEPDSDRPAGVGRST
jgi:hypothetical protein